MLCLQAVGAISQVNPLSALSYVQLDIFVRPDRRHLSSNLAVMRPCTYLCRRALAVTRNISSTCTNSVLSQVYPVAPVVRPFIHCDGLQVLPTWDSHARVLPTGQLHDTRTQYGRYVYPSMSDRLPVRQWHQIGVSGRILLFECRVVDVPKLHSRRVLSFRYYFPYRCTAVDVPVSNDLTLPKTAVQATPALRGRRHCAPSARTVPPALQTVRCAPQVATVQRQG